MRRVFLARTAVSLSPIQDLAACARRPRERSGLPLLPRTGATLVNDAGGSPRRLAAEMADIEAQRDAALRVVDRLRSAGHEAYFVGGCVRDELMGRLPREFDVATSADPDTVQALFPHNVAMGKQFGVIVAMLDQIPTEVATFRSDDAYVDGRRPTGVRFTTAREDAERRDFTFNALFLDPATGDIMDFVGGRGDLEARLLRAIGDPRARFREDKLRMLRAVRFATTGPFEIEAETWTAVTELASEITTVSWERIQAELSRILVSGRAEFGVRLLHESGLLAEILPEIAATDGVPQPPQFHPEGCVLTHTLLGLRHLDALEERPLELALGILLHDVGKPPTYEVRDRIRFDGHDRVGAEMTDDILHRLRYPNAVIAEVRELVRRHMAFVQIREWRPAKVRRFLTSPLSERHLALHRLDCLAAHGRLDTWTWCHAQRDAMLAETPPPPPLISGHDLIDAGYAVGPLIGTILASLDDERLEGRLPTKEEALAWVIANYPRNGGSDAA